MEQVCSPHTQLHTYSLVFLSVRDFSTASPVASVLVSHYPCPSRSSCLHPLSGRRSHTVLLFHLLVIEAADLCRFSVEKSPV